MKVALAFIKSNDLTVLYTVLNKLLISPGSTVKPAYIDHAYNEFPVPGTLL